MKFRYLPKAKLNNIPKAPGVYALSSPKIPLYIGKAANLKDRVKNHFQQPLYRDNLFLKDVAKIGYIKTDSDIDALILESQLIKQQQPKYNVMWKDDKGYFYVGITKENLPRIFLAHQPLPETRNVKRETQKERNRVSGFRFQVSGYIGPFVEGKAIKRVLRLLRKVFPYYTAKRHGSLLCQYCHLNLCPGPNPDPKEYGKNIKNLIAVLKGKKTSVLKQLEKDMRVAAKNQDFEKASGLRDQFLSLERIVSHARLFAPETSHLFNWSIMEKELKKLFGTKKRISRIEAFDISNIQGKQATGSQVTFLKGIPAKEWYRKYKIKISGKSNDFAMMQELVFRRLQHPEWPYPQLMVIDGGKGQLTAALKALRKFQIPRNKLPAKGEARQRRQTNPKLQNQKSKNLQATNYKLQTIKVVALAKKHNELFSPGRSKSILLRDLPQPLEHLFLHIRDEAHRFAISYHRYLRSKSVVGNVRVGKMGKNKKTQRKR